MSQTLPTACALAAVFAIVPLTVAAQASGDAPSLGLSLGIKGGGGGNSLTSPDGVPGYHDSMAFAEGGTGWGAGGGLSAELRMLGGHLGIEIDLLADYSSMSSSVQLHDQFNNAVTTEWSYAFTAIRIPLLIKGILESGITRFGLGIGPEISVGVDASRDIEVTNGELYPGMIEGFLSQNDAVAQTDVLLDVDLGVAFRIAPFALTADIRYAYNLTQPSDYNDRFDTISRCCQSFMASSTMDLRLLAGVAYEFGLD
jgi:hypothetical protein